MTKREKTVAMLVIIWAFIVGIVIYGGSLGLFKLSAPEKREYFWVASAIAAAAAGYLQFYTPYKDFYTKSALKVRLRFYLGALTLLSIIGVVGKRITAGVIQPQMHGLYITVVQICVVVGIFLWYLIVFKKENKDNSNRLMYGYLALYLLVVGCGFAGMYM